MKNLMFSLGVIPAAGVMSLLGLVMQPSSAQAMVLEYGDRDCLGFDCYGQIDPTADVTLNGLAANESSISNERFFHSFPFLPEADDYAGTDQIFCNTANAPETGDGYCNSDAEATIGSLTTVLDYSAALSPNEIVKTLTLGIASDDFQTRDFGGRFKAFINGQEYDFLSQLLDGLNNGGPSVKFFSVGVPLDFLTADNQLSIEIAKEGGIDTPDGFAADFFTVGVETVPTPAAILPVLMGMGSAATRKKQKQQD